MKKLIVVVLLGAFLLSSCSPGELIQGIKGGEPEKVGQVESSEEKAGFQEENKKVTTDGYDPEAEFTYFMEEQLDYDLGKLNPKRKSEVIEKYRLAKEEYDKEYYESEEYLRLKSEAYQILREEGYDIPLQSLLDAAEVLKKDLTPKEYEELIKLSSRSLEFQDEKQMLKDSLLADRIVGRFGLSAEELLNQSISEGIQLGLYQVKDGEITRDHLDTFIDRGKPGRTPEDHQKIWDQIATIVPEEYMAMIDRYEINTDGLGEIMAFVDQRRNNQWNLSIDPKDILSEKGEFSQDAVQTIVHELAHIVSLNQSQMTQDQDDGSTYTVEEGTLKESAYLNKYYQRFWKDLMGEAEQIQSDEDLYLFYENHQDEFVTEYAATNPGEDFAESFAFFVTQDKPQGNTIKEQKMLFFYEYPEFVAMRDRIRQVTEK